MNQPHETLPTPFELASLATRCQGRTPGDACEAALVLWKAAAHTLKSEEARRRFDAQRTNPPPPAFDMPKRYPVTPDAMVGLLLPGLKGRTADRAHLLREMLRDELRSLSWLKDKTEREPTESEVSDALGQFRKRPIEDAKTFSWMAENFLKWHERRKPGLVSEARSEAAQKRWNRKPVKKGR